MEKQIAIIGAGISGLLAFRTFQTMEKPIAIIGAGISGLLACKYTLSKGFHSIVFESQSKIGGVWTKSLETTKLQTPKDIYQFSDFPWPSSVKEDYPTQHQVLEYIEAYAHHFDLLRHIKFNTKVVSIDFEGPLDEEIPSWHLWGGTGEPFSSNGKWNVVAVNTQNHSTEVYQVDFVVLALGQFSGIPNIPEFPPGQGPETFQGEVIHSMDYAAMEYETAAKYIEGKRIVVVGFQKSAMDIAIECATANGVELPCTILYKNERWNTPDQLPWGVPLAYLYQNRFSELLVHKPDEGFLYSLLATVLSPVRWVFSKFVESHIKWKLPLAKFGMVPKHSFYQELSSCMIATVPENFYDKVEEGSILLKKTQNKSFCEEGLMVDGQDSPLKTDLVILATGFRGDKKLRNIFVSPTFQKYMVGLPDAPVSLYRECVHPRIPQLAIIGYTETIANLYTSEIRCKWLAELLNGRFKLPSIKEMVVDVGKWDKYRKGVSQNHRRPCIAGLHIWHNDQLCRDMGLNPKRKKGFFAELFEPYGPLDYASSS